MSKLLHILLGDMLYALLLNESICWLRGSRVECMGQRDTYTCALHLYYGNYNYYFILFKSLYFLASLALSSLIYYLFTLQLLHN